MTDPKHLADLYLQRRGQSRTAGEVRFIKDKSNDANQWAWQTGEQDRTLYPDYAFDPRKAKVLAKVLRATTAALGHSLAGYEQFSKLKSGDISPDGKLGGKGYIQKIPEMRRAYMNVVEALSALSDTLYDEVRAPHWTAISRQKTPEEQAEVKKIVQDALEIREDPEGWADQEAAEMDRENAIAEQDNLYRDDDDDPDDLDEADPDEDDSDDPNDAPKQTKMASRVQSLAARYMEGV
jgi:hypothetical protein